VSVWSRATEQKLWMPDVAEREGIRLLDGVGGDIEWWIYGNGPGQLPVGYLRVALTPDEFDLCPPGVVVADAGEAGPQRPRTRR
jgi:hypothetical protein